MRSIVPIRFFLSRAYLETFLNIFNDFRKYATRNVETPGCFLPRSGSSPRTSTRECGRPGRTCALVSIHLGADAASPAFIRAPLKGRLVIEVYLECDSVLLLGRAFDVRRIIGMPPIFGGAFFRRELLNSPPPARRRARLAGARDENSPRRHLRLLV